MELDFRFFRLRRAATLLAATAVFAAVAATPAWAGTPKKPARFRVTGVGTTSIGLAWRDRASNETRYKLRYRRTAAPSWTRLRLPRNTRRRTLTGLASATAYVAQVKACNGDGCSAWSGYAQASTLATNYGICSIFPPFSGLATAASAADQTAWNQDVSSSPVATNSATVIAALSGNLHPDFGGGGAYGIPYVLVPGSEPKIPVNFRGNGYDDDYGSESDPGPYPIPPNAPIEGGGGGDSHVIAMDVDNCKLYELYNADYDSVNRRWNASQGTVWDLRSALIRQDGWTSADAAGLPIFPGLVRFDEVRNNTLSHAIRVTFSSTANTYRHPATHCTNGGGVAQMGMRLRLKASTNIGGLTGDAAVITAAMKKYGLIVADNGSNWYFTGASDARWVDADDGDPNDLNQLKAIPGSAFEVVSSAGSSVSPCYS